MKNDQSEYDRIRAALNTSTLADIHGRPSPQHIQNRIAKLQNLGTQALNTTTLRNSK